NEFKKDMVVAEAVLTVYSGGMGTAALKGGKSVAKLDVDAPHGKQPHADMDADGGKGRGGLLHGSGVDDLLEGTPLKDGKLKTKAKLFDDMLKDFDLLTEKYQHNMLKQIFEKIRIKEEVMVDPVFGQSFSVWNISFFKDKKDGHGLQHIETSKGHVSEAPRNKDIPHEITPPKGGKASGDSGHSHHDEPVTDKKGNDANKNQPHEKENMEAEGTSKPDSNVSYGKVFPTRKIDLDTEGHIIERVRELRSKLSNRLKDELNFAYSEVDIEGMDKKEFYAHSSLNGDNKAKDYADYSLKPTKPKYEATLAPDRGGNIRKRDNDTEYKILNDLAARLDKLKEPSKTRGKIKLFTEIDTCASCSRIIERFHKDYPNIVIEVIHNGDELVDP
ncbi:deaminase domain-containing protein, partial [Brevibacillus parabrevis]|uniref:deaminase domain-containing protein n=1 Tax=Brevibacillus parabrevis TaxID=54914 RepID=UPI002E1D6017|nr:deaminase domain-containing protein [Brevibacillus parabrevis]